MRRAFISEQVLQTSFAALVGMAIGAAILLATLFGLSAAPAHASETAVPVDLGTRTVVLYGDSLAWESQAFFSDALLAAGVGRVITRTFGGTAICDWLEAMREDAAQLHPDVAVVEFSGNAFTPCMWDAGGAPLAGDTYLAKYGRDAFAVLDIFRADDTVVYFVGAPVSFRAEQAHDPIPGQLRAIYAGLGWAGRQVRFIDAGTAVTALGRWTATLPCLESEPCTGGTDASGQPVNVVRAPDGLHFCPGGPAATQGRTASCGVWASGAYRYGNAMAAPVARDLRAALAMGR